MRQVNLVLSRQTGFSSLSLQLIDKTDGFNWARYTKLTAIRPGFETVSQQHAAHAQQRSYSGHAESFSNTPKSSKRKEG